MPGKKHSIDDLRDIMARLRNPATGCPWDLKQDFRSIAAYTLEEAYEVVDVIERDAVGRELADELGDLLFQVVFHARMAEELGYFALDDVIAAICEKMVRRHPHVFADADYGDDAALHEAWEAQKARERSTQGEADNSVMAGVTAALPALLKAQKLQKRAARVGMDWHEAAPVFDKLREELSELEQALAHASAAAVREEAGDLLFSMVNLLRHLGTDAEQSLRQANRKFESRIRTMEMLAEAQGLRLAELDDAALDRLWNSTKIGQGT